MFVVEKRVDGPEMPPRSGGVGASRQDERIEYCTHCNWGLITLYNEVNVQFIALLSLFDRTQGRVCGGKVGSTDLKCHLDPAAWVLPGKINAMENCANCNRGLNTLSGEINVRVIVLFSLFDRTQGRIRGGKAGRQS